MTKRLYILRVLLSVLCIIAMNKRAHAWDPATTHTHITEYAANLSILGATSTNGDYLKNLGFSSGLLTIIQWDANNNGRIDGTEQQKIIQWMSDVGAQYEDGNAREVNHFHNPLKDWSSAGLGYLGISIWESTVLRTTLGTFYACFPLDKAILFQ
jgi:hypothetical protein